MTTKQVNYAGIAALITAITTAVWTGYKLVSKETSDEQLHASIFAIIDYRLRVLEQQAHVPTPAVTMPATHDAPKSAGHAPSPTPLPMSAAPTPEADKTPRASRARMPRSFAEIQAVVQETGSAWLPPDAQAPVAAE